MKYRHVVKFFLLLTLFCFNVANVSKGTPIGGTLSNPTQSAHILINLDEAKWGPAPPALPPGAQLAVLDGDPSKAGMPFAILAKFPNGYKISPHWHPTDEHVVVLKGTFMMGLGDKFSQVGAHALR